MLFQNSWYVQVAERL